MSDTKRLGRLPTIMTIAFLVIASFVLVATVMQAITQDSWGPIVMTGWLPAVMVASLWTPASSKSCRLRVRGRARR